MSGGRSRAQSNVIGVAILLGITMLSLGTLTATIGTVVQSNAGAADAGRVAADFDAALDPVEATGVHRGHVSFTDGRLSTVNRTVRVLNDSGVVDSERVGGLVYESGRYRVAFVAGGVVRGSGANARMVVDPPFAASDSVLLLGVARLNASETTVAGDESSVVLDTNVTHRRVSLGADGSGGGDGTDADTNTDGGNGDYRIAVETETPRAWNATFAEANATTTRRDFDGDGVPSVVADYPRAKTTYLVVHDLHLEVRHG